MLAMGRALMARPKLLLMDEPSMGLAPILVEQNFELIEQVNDSGVAVLVVEQNANMSLAIADRGYVLATGRIVLADRASALLTNDDLKKAYLGRWTHVTDEFPARIRHRFPIFERLVYVNSCSQGALSDAVRDAVRRLPAGLGREGSAVGLLGGARRDGAGRASPTSSTRTRTRSP